MIMVKVSSRIMHRQFIGIAKPLNREILWLNTSWGIVIVKAKASLRILSKLSIGIVSRPSKEML